MVCDDESNTGYDVHWKRDQKRSKHGVNRPEEWDGESQKPDQQHDRDSDETLEEKVGAGVQPDRLLRDQKHRVDVQHDGDILHPSSTKVSSAVLNIDLPTTATVYRPNWKPDKVTFRNSSRDTFRFYLAQRAH